MRYLAIVCCCLTLLGCGEESVELTVRVTTDLNPGSEFFFTEVLIDDELVHEQGAALVDKAYQSQIELNTFVLPPASRILNVRLLDLSRELVVSRLAIVDNTRSRTVQLVLTRDCSGVECGSSALALTCLAGECVDPRCDGDLCGTSEQCISAADCLVTNACARATCDAGACLYPSTGDSCEEGFWCHPFEGCIAEDVTPECITAAQCNDDNPCTSNACDDLRCQSSDLNSECAGGTCVLGECRECDNNEDCAGGFCNQRGDCVQCLSASDCPTQECGEALCDETGSCQLSPALTGSSCTNGFCNIDAECVECLTELQCPSDLPFCNNGACQTCERASDCDDQNECTENFCTDGSCTNPAAPNGVLCGAGMCTDGLCVGCTGDGDCSGSTPVCVGQTCVQCRDATSCDDGDVCTTASCGANNTCSQTPLTAGTSCGGGNVCDGVTGCVSCLGDQNCSGLLVCNSVNQCVECTSAPGCDDGNDCTQDACQLEQCSNSNLPFGSACSGGRCDSGTCVECVANGDCSGTSVCSAANQCVDCLNSTDCEDNNECTSSACSAQGDCSFRPVANGIACTIGTCQDGTCTSASCTDSVRNGTETDIDCGGQCPGCGTGETCSEDNDCAELYCPAGQCVAPLCSDGVQNGTETGVDCGGNCANCSICDTQTDISVEECLNLQVFFDATTGSDWTTSTGWNTTIFPCSWYGVECTNKRVNSLRLPSNNLQSTSFPGLDALTALTFLDLSGNSLEGIIGNDGVFPDTLQSISLADNQLRGRLPQLGPLTNLKELNLADNQLSGPLDPLLYDVEKVLLQNNVILGELPLPLTLPTGILTTFDVSNNQLVGGLMPIYPAASGIQLLNLSQNGFDGPIDISIFVEARFINLGANNFDGPFPELPPNLRQLTLAKNLFVGPISDALPDMLEVLHLEANRFEGQVPMTIAGLPLLPGPMGLSLRNNQCLLAFDPAFADFLESFDPLWNNGC